MGPAIVSLLLAGGIFAALWIAGNLSWVTGAFAAIGSAAVGWFVHGDFKSAAKRHDQRSPQSPRMTGGPRGLAEIYLYIWRASSTVCVLALIGAWIFLGTDKPAVLLTMVAIAVVSGVAKVSMPKLAERFLGVPFEQINRYDPG